MNLNCLDKYPETKFYLNNTQITECNFTNGILINGVGLDSNIINNLEISDSKFNFDEDLQETEEFSFTCLVHADSFSLSNWKISSTNLHLNNFFKNYEEENNNNPEF